MFTPIADESILNEEEFVSPVLCDWQIGKSLEVVCNLQAGINYCRVIYKSEVILDLSPYDSALVFYQGLRELN